MYSDIMKGINLLQQYNVKFGIFMVASKETIHKAKDMILELDEKYSPSRIGYSLPHWASNYQNEDLAEEFRDVLIELYKNRKKIKADIPQMSWRINPLREGKVKKFSCGLHTTQTTILPDKSFVRCSKIDNINDNLKEIFTNKLLDKNSPIELAKNENSCCSRCIALACCGGGCPFDGMKQANKLAENIRDFFKRVYSFLDKIKEKYRDKNILIVTHGSIGIPIYCYFNGIPEDDNLLKYVLKNCDIAIYEL